MNQLDKLILAFPTEIKIQVLKDALESDQIGVFVELSKVLLDAPITDGGLESEIIEKIHCDYIKANESKIYL